MLFNSWIFFLFLPLVLVMHQMLPQRLRWVILLSASYLFYGWWRPEFLILIAFSSVMDFYCAGRIYKLPHGSLRKRWLILSLVSNLGILFFFKYFYFFIGSTQPVQDLLHDYPRIKDLVNTLGKSLPVGISFYTFQTMSYTLDVYYGRAVPETSPGRFALFVSFFPQLVAGPIERFSHLGAQLRNTVSLNQQNLTMGFRLMLYGFFTKMVIADNLSYTVSSVFNDPGKWVYYWNIIGIFSFGFQIYADFFGYSLIAQGVARLFGVDLMDNFNRPYLATGITAFWQRWHISLSTWFRDYLYIPLGGNRVSAQRWIVNILIVFLLSGLWHGANYTFLIWGGLHGLYYLAERFIPVKLPGRVLPGLLTFLAVMFAWIFFRATDTRQAVTVIQGAVGLLDGSRQLDTQPYIFLLLFIFGAMELARGEKRFDVYCNSFKKTQRIFLYGFLLLCILVMCGSEYSPFIYFRF